MMKCLHYRQNRSDWKDPVPLGRIPFFGFVFVFEGALDYEIDGKALRLSPGDVLYLPKGSLRSRKATEFSRHVSFHFDTDETPDLPIYMPEAMTPPIRRLLLAFDEIAAECSGPEDERFTSFLRLIIAELQAGVQRGKEDPLVLSIRRFLASHLDQKLTLADVGRAVSFSPNHCQAIFRRDTGRSIIDTFLDMKMKKAKELISSGEYALSNVAEKVGFEDYNYFSRLFKARCGVSPSQFQHLIL